MTAFAAFDRLVQELYPKVAIVLGSGLGGVFQSFQESGSIAFEDIPGLPSTTVNGHASRLTVGCWNGVPILLFRGRLHLYEGHSREVVAEPVRIAANFGIKKLVLTNAVGGINPVLRPGSLMVIREHIKFVGESSCKNFVAERETNTFTPYSPRLIEVMQTQEARAGRELLAGVYAALTGPSYETPAEIRALSARGVDIVGMSTALEAEAASQAGMEVAAISCVTNAAAGLNVGLLNHADVLEKAKLGVQRLGAVLGHILGIEGGSPSATKPLSPH